jgi:hypothetical protein
MGHSYHICFAASSLVLLPSVAMASRIWSAIPVPAVPDPKITTLTSLRDTWLTCKPAIKAASVTHPVPWTSSLKQAICGRYFSSSRRAFLMPKSSLRCVSLLPLSFGGKFGGNAQMNVCVREDLLRVGDEAVDELVVFLAPDSLVAKAEVHVVFQKLFILHPC